MPSTIIRMLLNHFRWDKEKLMERYYDGDQEKLFSEAHVANPFKLGVKPVIKDSRIPNVEECEVGFPVVNAVLISNNTNWLCRFVYQHMFQQWWLDLNVDIDSVTVAGLNI